MPKKILGLGIFLLIIMVGIWYFAIKNYDYTIRYQTVAPPGKIYYKLLDWKFESLKNKENKEKVPFKKIIQTVVVENTPVVLNWNFIPVHDSLTKVQVHVQTKKEVFSHRLDLLTGKTEIQKELEKNLVQFKKAGLADMIFYDLEIVGKSTTKPTTCACIKLSSKISQKDDKMIKNIYLLSNYVLDNNLKMGGKPRIQILKWDMAKNYIAFNFCFPLQKVSKYPKSKDVFIKNLPAQTGLKAIFRGNYRNTHQAWFALLNYAELHHIPVSKKPLEIFQNNPEVGGNSKNWKSEIFLPLKAK